MLMVLKFYRMHYDIDETAINFLNWVDRRKKEFKDQNIQELDFYIPSFISTLVSEINKQNEIQRTAYRKASKSDEYHAARSQALRYLRKAETVVNNVAKGEFPGDY